MRQRGREDGKVKKVCELLFVISWLLCGCSVETVFDGGAPLFCLSMAVVVVCAAIICSGND